MREPLIRTRPHTAALARPLALALVAVALLAVVVAVERAVARPGPIGEVIAVIVSALAVLATARLVRRVWEWDRTLLLVDARSVVVVRGGIRRSEQIVPLAAVRRLRVRRSLPGRILGYGTIELGLGARASRLRFVPQPDVVSEVIAAHAGQRAASEGQP